MQWEGQHYVDTALPFGLRQPQSCSLHCTPVCAFNLDFIVHLCQHLGIPLAVAKQVGPTTCIIYLGIEVDSIAMVLRLPQDKLIRIQEPVATWKKKEEKEYQEGMSSLAGQLQHAATVLCAGHTFFAVY